MILTTNRVKSMDLAFDSRADIRLHYTTLDTAARRKVWANFVAKLPGGSSIDEQDLNTLAEREMNGRQIKNAIKLAYLLASGEGTITGFGHVQTVLGAMMR
jgi:AAA+ superfamily predicted ATPase